VGVGIDPEFHLGSSMETGLFKESQNDGLQQAMDPRGPAFGNGFSIPKLVGVLNPAELFLELLQG